MNWLAHLLLSEPTPEFRLGSLLPDLAPASALVGLPMEYQRGIRRHRQTDAYTDAHPVFRRSIQRLGPRFRRFGGVLVDIFYDHVLAREWESFATIPLPEFAAEIYASLESRWIEIPADARSRLEMMRHVDLLCSYREIDRIAEALSRIGGRLRRPFDLSTAVPILQREYTSFHHDFRAFFPELRDHLALELSTSANA